MNYIFLIGYCIFLIPVFINKNFSKNLKFLLTFAFLIFIFIFRDPNAAQDFNNYVKAALNDQSLSYLRYNSPLYFQLSDFLVLNLKFSGPAAVQIMQSIPAIFIGYLSLIIGSPLSFATFLSSETFPLLSFNGMRQGLSISFMIGSFVLLYYSNDLTQKYNARKLKFISIILLIVGAGFHASSIVVLSFILISYFLRNFFFSLISLKINKQKFIYLLIFIIFSLVFFLSSTNFELSKILLTRFQSITFDARLNLNQPNRIYHLFTGFYRVGLMVFFSIYFLKKTSELIDKSEGINFLRDLVINFNYALVGFIIIGFASPLIFSRFSHYCIVPIYFSVVGLKKFEKYNLPIYFIAIGMGLVTYSYSSILSNLI